MSRIGKQPVKIPDKVQVTISPEGKVTVKGDKATEIVQIRPEVTAKMEDGHIIFVRRDDTKVARSMHGLYRALVQNAVTGVSTGWTKVLEYNGVGYRAIMKGSNLELSLGYSHPISFPVPKGIAIEVDKQNKIHIKGASRAQVGQTAAVIRSLRPPEPYLGKGIKYVDEHIRRKAGKAAAK